MSLRFIGITGGVGAGKSEILKYIEKHYRCEIYLADDVAREIQRAGTECFEKLVELLGKEVVGADGELDRHKMAEMIFANESLLTQVNKIVHPAVKVFLLEHLEKAKKNSEVELFFVEAALLIEAGYKEVVDELWYIYADDAIRIQRLWKARGYDEKKSRSIIGSQLSEKAFRDACDFVIDNSGLLEDTYRQIDQKLHAYTRVAEKENVV